ncbi:MAG: hypothetical protein KGD66_04270 [Candidatus Lokiarchaeota archaeon]|nr:hypothetical protein [Candidatus Lokiarchaeota archaeon]
MLLDFLQVFAEIIGAILTFLKPIVSPIGAWMVEWIEVVLGVFPDDSLSIYIGIFIFLIVVGAIVNSLWTGDAPPNFLTQKGKLATISDEKLKEVEEIEDLTKVYKDDDDRKRDSDQIDED